MKKVFVLLLVVLTVVSVAACGSKNNEPTTPPAPTVPNSLLDSVDTKATEEETEEATQAPANTQTITCKELSMTLPDDFIDQSSLSSDEAIVGIYSAPEGSPGTSIVRESKEQLSSEYSVDQYLALQRLNANSKAENLSDIQEKNGRKYFDYTVTSNGFTFKYFSTAYVSSDAYWLVQYFCFADEYDEHLDTFLEWAETVTFS